MRRRLTGSFILPILAVATLLLPRLLPAQVQDRIAQPLQVSESQPVRGNVHPFARTEHDRGEAAGSMMLHRMVMTFSPSAAHQADLNAILSEQQNPLSPYYHRWLSPEQFADRFGLSASDIGKVVDWLQGHGFSVDETARSRSYVAFSGTVSQVEAAFGTPIHHYLLSGELHYANVSDPKLPWPLASLVTGIRGLNDFRPKPRAVRPRFTSSISGNHYLAPDDFATIYNLKALYNSGIDGTGQKIAVAGQTDLILSDIATFRSVSGLPANVPTVVLVPGSPDPGIVSGDIVEANLDVQWAGAVAPKATIVYVNSKNGAFDSLNYAISQNLAPVISISYGDCEPNFSSSEINTLISWGQQANAQGQTIVGPSGDSGAADCDYPNPPPLTSATQGLAVDIPAALPYVTGVGGSTFNEGSGTFWSATNNANNGSALSYIPETAWNDTAFEIANGGSLSATGGGVSKLFPKPSWQTGVGVPNDGRRDVPDISFNASFDHDGYLMCSQGSCVNGYRAADNSLFVVGGTSAGVPTFAGIMALINQKLGAPQGNANPRLYQLAGTSTDAFHDITTGDNKVPCTAGTQDCPSGGGSIGYSAGVGYDPVTGLGSANAFNLVMEWNGSTPPAQPDFTVAAVIGTATVAPGTAAQYSITLTPANAFVGGVSLAVTGLPAGVTPTFNPNPVSITGAAAQSSVLQATTTSSTAPGTYTLTVTAVGDGLTHTAGLSLTVTGSPQAQQPALRFIPLTPCRVADTRNVTGPFGGPSINSHTSRDFPIPSSSCGVPSTAVAYSLNVTAVPLTSFLAYITVYPTGQPLPLVSTLNSSDGRIKANAAIVQAGTSGAVSVYATDPTDVILDINGYFVPASTNPSALAFFPLTPCRVADTRNPTGSLGGPSLVNNQARSFPIQLSNCHIPTTAQAYSLNFTAVPKGYLGFLTTWPTGQGNPWVSTLNATTGQVTANAAIVPAGPDGAINLFVQNDADMVIDINGYFAPSTSPSDLSLYTLPPCRVRDTRDGIGLFTGTLTVDTSASACRVPADAQAVVLNATVVPAQAPFSYLTLWPRGQAQPFVSTLNASDGMITSNMAIVPTDSAVINAYGTNPTHLVLDTTGFFATGTSTRQLPFVLTVARSGNGTGTITSSDGKMMCGAICAGSYASGTVVTLTASATAGSTFAGWSGGGCSGTGSCTVGLSASVSVTAAFNPPPTKAQGVYEGATSTGVAFETIILPNDEYYGLYGLISGNVFYVYGMLTGQGSSHNGSYTASVTAGRLGTVTAGNEYSSVTARGYAYQELASDSIRQQRINCNARGCLVRKQARARTKTQCHIEEVLSAARNFLILLDGASGCTSVRARSC